MLEVLRCCATIDLCRPWSLNHLDFHAGWRFRSIKNRIYHEISLVLWHLNIFVGCLAFEHFRSLFGIWTGLALSLQEWCRRILHYWISSAHISVLGTTVHWWAAGCVLHRRFSLAPLGSWISEPRELHVRAHPSARAPCCSPASTPEFRQHRSCKRNQ